MIGIKPPAGKKKWSGFINFTYHSPLGRRLPYMKNLLP
jgi:hypothetical protein